MRRNRGGSRPKGLWTECATTKKGMAGPLENAIGDELRFGIAFVVVGQLELQDHAPNPSQLGRCYAVQSGGKGQKVPPMPFVTWWSEGGSNP